MGAIFWADMSLGTPLFGGQAPNIRIHGRIAQSLEEFSKSLFDFRAGATIREGEITPPPNSRGAP